MSTEYEILANQTQTLEEALDRLEDRSADVVEPTYVPDVNTDALDIAVECFKATVDIYHTINREGVSQADIQALRAIQAKMRPHAKLTSKVALEAYEGMFTTKRSMINQTISQEATLAEIGHTLKEWFFIFVDFIIRVTDWARRVWNSEDLIRNRLKSMDSYLQTMYNLLQELVKYNTSMGRDASPDLLAIAEVVLNDTKLTRSENMLMAFNVGHYGSVVKAADKDVDKNFNFLMKDVASLKTHIEHNRPGNLGYDYGMEINVTAEALEDMTVASVDNAEFVKQIGLDFFTHPKTLVARPIFAPSHNIEQVQRLAKEVRSIKRNVNFDNLKEVDIIVQAIENMSSSVKGLERVIKYKQALYADYYKASATYANFYIRARETVEESIKTHSAADLDKVMMDRLRKAWESLLDRMGI